MASRGAFRKTANGCQFFLGLPDLTGFSSCSWEDGGRMLANAALTVVGTNSSHTTRPPTRIWTPRPWIFSPDRRSVSCDYELLASMISVSKTLVSLGFSEHFSSLPYTTSAP